MSLVERAAGCRRHGVHGVARAWRVQAFGRLIRPERLDRLLNAAFEVVETHIGVVSITDAEVLRAERF